MEESESAVSARHSRYQVSPSDFDLVALAGRGAFGKVSLCRSEISSILIGVGLGCSKKE